MEGEPLDLQTLLAPLDTGEQGAGTDLRGDYSATSPYQRLRDARAAARAEERARDAEGASDGEDVQAQGWRDVLRIGSEVLGSSSKDIEIAAWMTEALVRGHGLAGLNSGAQLIAGLCQDFWEGAFPQPDEDGMEVRSLPIGGLSGGDADGTVMQPLRRLTLFRRADGSPVSLYLWDQAEQVMTLEGARREARLAAGTPELAALEAEAKREKAYLIGMRRATESALQAWSALDKLLDERLGRDAPSLRKVSNLLERMREVIARVGGVDDAAADAHPTPDGQAPAGAPPGAISAGTTAAAAGAMTRDSALQQLDRIAEFFRRTEPHSPLAYTLDDAVRRGKLSLPDLLAEIVPDVEVRNGILTRLGIRTAQE